MEPGQKTGVEPGQAIAIMEPGTEVSMETESLSLVIEATEAEGGKRKDGAREGEGGVESEDVAMLELVDQMEIEISDHEGEGDERGTGEGTEEVKPGEEEGGGSRLED